MEPPWSPLGSPSEAPRKPLGTPWNSLGSPAEPPRSPHGNPPGALRGVGGGSTATPGDLQGA
eukprot:469924-Alexandrium_andersonii.AAC.1